MCLFLFVYVFNREWPYCSSPLEESISERLCVPQMCSLCVCLHPLGAIVGDNVSCPLRPHLHRHPSWCHLSWPRTKLSPWEKPACRAPCSRSTQPCPAPTHACSASALLVLITASHPGFMHTQNHGATRGNRDADAPLSSHYRSVWVYVTAIASEWGCCVGRCCPGSPIH